MQTKRLPCRKFHLTQKRRAATAPSAKKNLFSVKVQHIRAGRAEDEIVGEPIIVHPSAASIAQTPASAATLAPQIQLFPFIVPLNGPLVHFFPLCCFRNQDATRLDNGERKQREPRAGDAQRGKHAKGLTRGPSLRTGALVCTRKNSRAGLGRSRESQLLLGLLTCPLPRLPGGRGCGR